MTNLFDGMHKMAEKEKLAKEFHELDPREIAKFSDKELALWQMKHPSDTPQFKLAENEWNRRLIANQIKATRFAALVGLVGVILGAVLSSVLQYLPKTKTPTEYQKCLTTETNSNFQIKSPQFPLNTSTNKNISSQ
jgi:hypothetical protein